MKLLSCKICAVAIVAYCATTGFAQFPIPWDGGGANSNWTTAANWNHPSGGLPSGAFDEIAVIDNGDTAVINSNLGSISFPDGPPGALQVSNGSTLQITGSGAFLVDDSGPSVDGAASFTSGGTLSITGAAASFTSTSLSFAGGGIYKPVLTSGAHGLISIPGSINFNGGTLRPTVGFSPVGAQSWVLADATSIDGTFTFDTSASGVGPGSRLTTEVIAGGVHGQQLKLNLTQVLSLTVNADTGAASISSPTGTPITITGYSVSSPGQLDPAGWTKLQTSVGAGWGVAGTPTTSRLDEIAGPIPPGNTTQGSLTVNATPRALGNPFNEQSLSFREAADVTFEYVTNTGAIVEGTVQYTGLNAVNNLLLTVDPATGQARLQNSSQSTIKLKGYSILSDSGSLKPANGSWSSLADQGKVGVDEANATSTHLSELIPSPANDLTLTPGQTFQMGSLFNTSGTQDLELEFLIQSTGLDGDFNEDGFVNAADYTVWRDGLGGEFSAADYQVWKDNFGASGSGGGFAIYDGTVKYASLAGAASISAVPEPTSASLVALCLVLVSTLCQQRSRG